MSRSTTSRSPRPPISFSHAVSELLHGEAGYGDLATQLAEVAGWIDREVDAIVVMPISAAALQPLVEQAHA